MTDYAFDMQLVVDPTNPSNVVQDGEISLYDPSDVAGANPLALKDPSGLPIINPLLSNANGFLQPFVATVPQVMWKSGTYQGYFNSYTGMRDEAIAAREAAQDSATSAAASAALVDAPADEAIAAALAFDGSASRAVLESELTEITEEQVPPLVVEALASDDAPAAAAAAAVDTALAGAGVFNGVYPIPANSDLAFTMTDAEGRRSWVEVDAAGKPTAESAAHIDKAMSLLPSLQIPVPTPITEGSGLSYVLTDSAGRKSELQLDFNGRFTGPFPERILAASAAAAGVAAAGIVQTSRVPLVGWGDSMMAANWIATTASILGVTSKQYGVGGQGSNSIAARQNGVPALVTLPGNSIPAAATPVTLTSISTVVYSSSTGTGISSGKGWINGVLGTLARDNTNNVHTFTRDVAGTEATWVAPGTAFIAQQGVETRANITLIWSGRNSFKSWTPQQIVDSIRGMVDYLTAVEKRFLILEIPPWVGEELPATGDRPALDAANAAIAAAWPRDYVPQMTWLRSDEAFAAAGISKTAQDITDITNGITPVSFRGDSGHLNTLGNTTLAGFMAKVIQQKGWTLT